MEKLFYDGAPASTNKGQHASASVKWLYEMSNKDRWNLSAKEVADLLGGLSVRKYHELKRNVLGGQGIKLSRDCQERISLLLSIYKNLSIIAPECRIDCAYS